MKLSLSFLLTFTFLLFSFSLKGMVETESNAYSIIGIFQDRIKVIGYGRESDRILLLK